MLTAVTGEEAILENRGCDCFAITDYLTSHIQNEFACPSSPWEGEKKPVVTDSCSSKVKDGNSWNAADQG